MKIYWSAIHFLSSDPTQGCHLPQLSLLTYMDQFLFSDRLHNFPYNCFDRLLIPRLLVASSELWIALASATLPLLKFWVRVI